MRGVRVNAVARELDLVASALGNWVKQAQADRSKGRTGLTTLEIALTSRLNKRRPRVSMQVASRMRTVYGVSFYEPKEERRNNRVFSPPSDLTV